MPGGRRDPVHLSLKPAAESVGTGRRFASAALAEWGLADLAGDAELVVSELVTNAVLHARTPLDLRLVPLSDGLRIEVTDSSPAAVVTHATAAPHDLVSSLLSDDGDLDTVEELLSIGATTGRGLQVVQSLAAEWGFEGLAGQPGKTVWAVIGTPPVRPEPAVAVPPASGATAPSEPATSGPAGAGPAGAGPAAAGREGRQAREGRATVRFGRLPDPAGIPRVGHPVRLVAVPVWLALESEMNIDTLIREFQVIQAAGGPTDRASAQIGAVTDFLSHFGGPRQTGQVALRDAVEGGDRLLDYELLVPVDAVPALHRLNRMLDRVTEFCERGELLALAPTAVVRDFRHWYVDEIDGQLQGRPPQPCPFTTVASERPDAGGAEVELSEAASEAIARIGGEMASADEAREATGVFLTECVQTLGASHASLCLRARDSDRIDIADSIGLPGAVSAHWESFDLSDDVPASEVIRTGRSIVIRTRSERDVRYPVFNATPVLDDTTFACIPLIGSRPASRPVGSLNVSFARSRDLNDADLRLLGALCAELADRLASLAAGRQEGDSAERRRVYETILAAAAPGGDLHRNLHAAVEGLASYFGTWCSAFDRGESGEVRLVAGRHPDPEVEALMVGMEQRWPPARDAGAVVRCLADGQTVVFQVVPEGLLSEVALDEEHLAALRRSRISSLVVAPVCAGGEPVAALSVAKHGGRYLTDTDIRLTEDVARAVST